MRYFTLIPILCYCFLSAAVHAETEEMASPNEVKPSATVVNNVKKLLETRQCAECDLRYADLSHQNLDGVELLDAKLQHANLSHSQFKGG